MTKDKVRRTLGEFQHPCKN